MAGTVFGLGLSQRVDTNGKPDSGWLLYLYSANSSTPVTAYKDTALTAGLEHPWPIEADSSGMMPSFWLADGSYRARATSNDGARTFFDLGSVLALGASSGSAPSGGVDPNAIFQTGDTMFQEFSGTRSGWVRDNGRTIGSATSGASERANSDTQALFTWLWNNFSDSICPVSGGRGATASSDWVSNKQITLLDKRGVGAIGLDDMGNSAAGRLSGVPVVSGGVTTAGSIIGESTHVLTISETAPHDHGGATGSTTPTIAFNGVKTAIPFGTNTSLNGGSSEFQLNGQGIVSTAPFQPHTHTISSQGDGSAHNNVQRSITGTWYRKL